MNKDKIFSKPIIKQFEFDENVASVFDDMLNRSVPFYDEVLNLTVYFALKYLKNGDIVYDLGCSTASTLIKLAQKSSIKLKLIGVDNSNAMIKQAISKTKAYGLDINFINDDIFNEWFNNGIDLDDDIVIFLEKLIKNERRYIKFYSPPTFLRNSLSHF